MHRKITLKIQLLIFGMLRAICSLSTNNKDKAMMNNHNESKGKKVIHVVQHLAPGGIESLALDLLTFANPNDHILLVSLEGTKEDAINRWPRLKPFADKLAFLDKQPGVQMGLIHLIAQVFKSVKPDVVHTHHIGPLFYAGYAARMANVAVRIHTEHDAWHLENKKQLKLQKLLLKLAQPTLVADASHVSKKLAQSFSYKDSVVIKNGVDCKKFTPGSKLISRENLNLPQDKYLIGCAGRLQTVKSFDNAIKAISIMPENVHLAIAGSGPEEAMLKELALKLEVETRVHFMGRLDNMPQFYQSLDLFLLPSLREGFPLSPLEAQACNIPSIATNVGGCPEVICPKTGSIIRKNSVTDIASVALEMMCKKSSHMPREFVVNGHDVRQMVKAYEELATGVFA